MISFAKSFVLILIPGNVRLAASYVGLREESLVFSLLVTIGFVWTYTNFVTAEKHTQKLENIEQYLDRLTDYAKEIDPRFDEERRLIAEVNESLEKGGLSLAGMHHNELVKEKKARGERTLSDPI